MNERVARLREESVQTRPWISAERAELVTDFYASGIPLQVSPPVCRALAFRHLMEKKTVYIGEGELIVGERGPAPKGTPTYPELCCHTPEDFDVMRRRRRTRFEVGEEVYKVYREKILPFWKGKTMREKVFASMTEEWKKAFEAGVFTEFMEQRAPGHAILDDKIYRKGFLDFIEDIRASRESLDFLEDREAWEKKQELDAMEICARALIRFAERHAEKAGDLAAAEKDPTRRAELERIARVCRRVPARPPRDFHEALQMYWFVHLGVITELNTWDSFNPGRLDQHLLPFYEQGLASGTLTEEQARELLQCLWIKFNNQPAPPKVGITEEQSGTYTDFALINLGGLTPEGEDAVNQVSYLLLDVIGEMRLVQPSSCIQVSRKNPDAFVKKAAGIIRTGFGQPSVFNTDTILEEMLYAGKSMADARAGGPSGCVTISAFGKESCTLTGYFNWVKILEVTLHDGKDPRTGKQVGLPTGDPRDFESYEELFQAWKKQVRYFLDLKIAGNNVIERLYAGTLPAPFLSILVDDCVKKGKDYHDEGPRYRTTYIQGVGLGSVTDSLSALKHHVFGSCRLSMEELLEALEKNFEGKEALRALLLEKTPKYGNDDDRADDITRAVFRAYLEALDGRPNTKGGKYRVNLLPTTVHVYFGSVTGAAPDGRKAGLPLSDGISPAQGADRKGPTAVLRSAAKIDHARTGGTLLNLKFSPQVLESEADLEKLVKLIRSYFTLGGHHVQFNVVTAAALREAQAEPERHRDLIVRVAGYSDYFVEVGKELQDEIIARTEHCGF